MRSIRERLAMVMTLAFLALAVSQAGSAGVVATAIAVIAVGMLLGARYAGVTIRSRELTIGERARQHRESMADVAAPRHPATPGRTRSRAPAEGLAAA
jgi:hypothetical protein